MKNYEEKGGGGVAPFVVSVALLSLDVYLTTPSPFAHSFVVVTAAPHSLHDMCCAVMFVQG